MGNPPKPFQDEPSCPHHASPYAADLATSATHFRADTSAVKLLRVFENVETVLAIEMLTATQAFDYRLPLRPGRGVEAAHRLVRERTPHREADYLFQEDLASVFALLRGRELLDVAGLGEGNG